ncbi:MAG: hypothetical protein QM767_29680 [Anaeromyxobacter sp.]
MATNYMGHPYSYTNGPGSWWHRERHTYALGWNDAVFGGGRAVTDVVGVDYYPLDGVRAGITDTMHRLGTVLDTIRDENLGLLPVFSYVETADAGNTGGTGHPTPWKPTPAQLRMITWFNVAHEAKGIDWFHYFSGGQGYSTPPEDLVELATFTRQIGELSPAVLGPRTGRTVTVAASGGGRVDTLLRRHQGRWLLIAVRVSEFAYQDATATTPPPPAQPDPITVQLSIDGAPLEDAAAEVYEEGRTVQVSGGTLTDTFAPYAVHIYWIRRSVTATPRACYCPVRLPPSPRPSITSVSRRTK